MREAADRVFKVMWDRNLRKEREWRAYRDNYAPSRGLFSPSEGEDRKHKGTIRRNSFPMTILEESAAGMQSGLASPGRNWFTLTLADTRLRTIERVKAWVGQCEEIMAAQMLATNFYDSFVDMQEEELAFGTAAMLIDGDPDSVFVCRTLTIGEYAIDADDRGQVCRFARAMPYTAQQLVSKFGVEHLPEEIRSEVEDRERLGSGETYVVHHLVQPNDRYQADTPGAIRMRFQSLWWMPGYQEPDFLCVSGYEEFPFIVGRWKVIGSDVYGRKHPGEHALDDVLTLQDLEMDARRAVERSVTPPLLVPTTLKSKYGFGFGAGLDMGLDMGLNAGAGKTVWYDPINDKLPVIQNLYNVNFDYNAAEAKIERLKAQIERAFYVDLFRLWSSMKRQNITATQALAEESEKGYILAPVTMRQTSEVLDKCIIRIFNIMLRAGRFPPPPPELEGGNIRIEYVSEFALLQKRAMREGIETLMAFSGQLAQLQTAAGKPPEALDRIDADETIEVIAEMYGIKSGIVLGDDAVARIREARAEQTRQAERQAQTREVAAALPGGARAAKDLSETRIGGTSALDALLRERQ
jgi:hypothetical protein